MNANEIAKLVIAKSLRLDSPAVKAALTTINYKKFYLFVIAGTEVTVPAGEFVEAYWAEINKGDATALEL